MTIEEVQAHAQALQDLGYLVRGTRRPWRKISPCHTWLVDSDEDFYIDWEDDPSVVESRRQERDSPHC